MTPNQRKNVYVQASGGDEKGLRAGIGYLLAECERLNLGGAWIICPQKSTFTGNLMEAALVKEGAKLLGKGERLILNKIQIVPKLATKLPMIGDGSPVLTAYLSNKDLAKVDGLYEVPSLIVVPFAPAADASTDSETKAWRGKWSPEMIGPA